MHQLYLDRTKTNVPPAIRKKGLATDAAQGPTLPSTTACVIFRAAEAYLNYMEADYELNNSLDATVPNTGKLYEIEQEWIPIFKKQ